MHRFERASQRTYFQCDLRRVYVPILPRTNRPPATTTFAHILTQQERLALSRSCMFQFLSFSSFPRFNLCQATRPCELLFRTLGNASYDAYGPPLVPILQ